VKHTLVAGIGSPFGADQLGWQVIETLESDPGILDCCDLLKLDRPGADLVAIIQRYARVILVDAVQSDQPRGTCVQLDSGQISQQASGLSSHNFGVAEAIALAAAMGQLPRELVLFGLDAGETPDVAFETGEIDKLIDRVADELNERETGQIIPSQS
jgi:hydrogenase maturation protease